MGVIRNCKHTEKGGGYLPLFSGPWGRLCSSFYIQSHRAEIFSACIKVNKRRKMILTIASVSQRGKALVPLRAVAALLPCQGFGFIPSFLLSRILPHCRVLLGWGTCAFSLAWVFLSSFKTHWGCRCTGLCWNRMYKISTPQGLGFVYSSGWCQSMEKVLFSPEIFILNVHSRQRSRKVCSSKPKLRSLFNF